MGKGDDALRRFQAALRNAQRDGAVADEACIYNLIGNAFREDGRYRRVRGGAGRACTSVICTRVCACVCYRQVRTVA